MACCAVLRCAACATMVMVGCCRLWRFLCLGWSRVRPEIIESLYMCRLKEWPIKTRAQAVALGTVERQLNKKWRCKTSIRDTRVSPRTVALPPLLTCSHLTPNAVGRDRPHTHTPLLKLRVPFFCGPMCALCVCWLSPSFRPSFGRADRDQQQACRPGAAAQRLHRKARKFPIICFRQL